MWYPRFDPEQHRYYHPVTSVELPGVNRLLRQAGLVDASYFYDEIRRRGTIVHDICWLMDRDDLASCDPKLEGYRDSYARLLDEGTIAWDHDWSERSLADQWGKYAGTPDRWGTVCGWPAVGEFKCGSYVPWHELQTSGYARLRKSPRGKRWREYLIYLHSNGSKAELKRCTIPDREHRFTETVNLFWWRYAHGDRSCFADKEAGNPLADYGIELIAD
jgi:hypothetical protein